MITRFKAWLKTWFKEHVDYRIVGEYYDTKDGIHYVKKYQKKYFLKLNRKKYITTSKKKGE